MYDALPTVQAVFHHVARTGKTASRLPRRAFSRFQLMPRATSRSAFRAIASPDSLLYTASAFRCQQNSSPSSAKSVIRCERNSNRKSAKDAWTVGTRSLL